MIDMEKLTIVVGKSMSDALKDIAKDPVNNIHKYSKNAFFVKDANEAMSWITVEKLSLIQKMLSFKTEVNISDLAELTDRKQSAISRDILGLEAMGAIKKHKKGRTVFIEPKINSIEIKFG